MKIRRDPEAGRRAVSLLATAFVILIGAIATAFMVLSVADRASWKDWAAWGILFGGVAVFVWSLHAPTDRKHGWQSLSFWLNARDRSDPLAGYVFRRRRARTTDEPLGSNQPPTLESLRETAESSVKWVPHGSAPERKPRRRGKR